MECWHCCPRGVGTEHAHSLTKGVRDEANIGLTREGWQLGTQKTGLPIETC